MSKIHPAFPLSRALAAASIFAVFTASATAQDDTFKPNAPRPAPKQKNPDLKPDLKKEGETLFSPGKSPAAGNPAGSSAWSIVLTAFRNEDQAAQAAAALQTIRAETGLAEAYTEVRGEATVIAYGRYADPASRQALADLARVRAVTMVAGGEPRKVFGSAFLAPPAEIKGANPDHDLRNARKLNGKWAIYTLQIGVYSREDRKPASTADLAEFRRTAEQAVAKLRREGEQAFYYHGPNRSMVTIGIFGEDDFDAATTTDKNPSLTALRQRFPYNLQNGLGIKQKFRITDPDSGRQVVKEKLQPSNLVGIPND
jgi:hypothetical protein